MALWRYLWSPLLWSTSCALLLYLLNVQLLLGALLGLWLWVLYLAYCRYRALPLLHNRAWHELFADAARHRARPATMGEDGETEPWRAVLDALPCGVLLVDDAQVLRWCNRVATEWLAAGELYEGQRITTLLRTPEVGALLRGEVDSAMIEREVASPVPGRRHLRCYGVPIDLTPSEHRHLLVLQDDTEAVRIEGMRRDFTANLSHELRTPLSVLVACLDILGEPTGTKQADREELLEGMRRQLARLSSLAEQLLQLAGLERSVLPAPHAEHNLHALLSEITSDIALGNAGKGAQLSLECSQDLVLLGEREELCRAFSNLLQNALHYSGRRCRVDIGASTRGEGAPSDQALVVSVKDNGIGIASHHIPHLTERFYRVASESPPRPDADGAELRASPGAGLGLAIVKHVLRRHDARLVIESKPGAGSVFSCHFPPGRWRALASRSGTATH